ncbi:hypothetical protein Lal_00039714 [Lupinus albus]|nr:hypothetical protein Lal_00039714 [Lupinus albus]
MEQCRFGEDGGGCGSFAEQWSLCNLSGSLDKLPTRSGSGSLGKLPARSGSGSFEKLLDLPDVVWGLLDLPDVVWGITRHTRCGMGITRPARCGMGNYSTCPMWYGGITRPAPCGMGLLDLPDVVGGLFDLPDVVWGLLDLPDVVWGLLDLPDVVFQIVRVISFKSNHFAFMNKSSLGHLVSVLSSKIGSRCERGEIVKAWRNRTRVATRQPKRVRDGGSSSGQNFMSDLDRFYSPNLQAERQAKFLSRKPTYILFSDIA